MATPQTRDPRGNFRPFCDRCGDKLWPYPLLIEQARNVAYEHAWRLRHVVRIEPWDSFALVESVVPQLPLPYPGETERP